MSELSTQSYKGTRDYFPDEKRQQNYIFNIWRRTLEGFGYEEYGAPMLEPLEIYMAKSGQELAGEQTYTFEDRGGRQVAIRPEMTPSISRMVAARRQELAMPARLYSIANFMLQPINAFAHIMDFIMGFEIQLPGFFSRLFFQFTQLILDLFN